MISEEQIQNFLSVYGQTVWYTEWNNPDAVEDGVMVLATDPRSGETVGLALCQTELCAEVIKTVINKACNDQPISL